MPCNPSDNNLQPGYTPGLPIPGLGIPIAPVQMPIPNFSLPDGFPADLLEMINALTIQWPGGTLLPQVDNTANTLLKYLANIFTQIAPFLSLYNMFMALLNMVQCIIDVICAFPNPWKVARAFKRLIKNCLLPFLNLFPATALLAMIISLLLLLIALIEYLIARILQIIEDLLANFELLAKGVTLQDAESTKAIAFKISSLLCIIENLLAIFGSLGAIFAIINSLAQIGGPKLCSKSSGSDCCGDDVCPGFISDNPDGIPGVSGKLIYYKQINPNNINKFQRNESWQFVNMDATTEYQFKDIITIYDDGSDFWPEDRSFSTDSQLKKVPYTLDLKIKSVDVSNVNDNDTKGPRDIIVKDVIVSIKPYTYVRSYDNSASYENTDGTLYLTGGKAYELDGTPVYVNGVQASLTTLIHQDDNETGLVPGSDDRLQYQSIEYTLKINQEALMYYNLITLGCLSTIRIEADLINSTVSSDPILISIPDIIPDLDGTTKCAKAAITKLRKSITTESINTFKLEIVQCLETLKDSTTKSVCEAIQASVDVFQTTGELDTKIQFTSRPITVKVVLYDKNGNLISYHIPTDCQSDIAKNITGDVTLGSLSEFSFDNELSAYTAKITSAKDGSGVLQLKWKNNYLSSIENRDNVDVDTSVVEKSWDYMFVGIGEDSAIRRDETDISINMVV